MLISVSEVCLSGKEENIWNKREKFLLPFILDSFYLLSVKLKIKLKFHLVYGGRNLIIHCCEL